jgi:uncharacterized protein DUF6166
MMGPTSEDQVVYRGIRGPAGSAVIVIEDLAGRRLGHLPHIVRHSPAGLNWGYGGSGPADAARSLLLDALGEQGICTGCGGTGRVVYDPADVDEPQTTAYDQSRSPEAYADDGFEVTSCWQTDCDGGHRQVPYQAFKWDNVAGWEDDWTIRRSQILTWLHDAGWNLPDTDEPPDPATIGTYSPPTRQADPPPTAEANDPADRAPTP